MTSEIDEFRNSLVAAVQAELERHASAVVAEVERLRQDGVRERAELRAEFTDQVSRLSQALEQNDARGGEHADKVRALLEQRLEELEKRQVRRLDDVMSSLETTVREAARPMMTDLREENEGLVRRVENLDGNLRKFDEQAARMVTYFNDVSQQMETRQDELAESLKSDVASQIESLRKLVEDNDSAVRKFQNDVGQQVSTKLNDAEDRFNNRLLAAENRIKEDAGQQIADIDLHVSRVSGNLDESLGVMNDRISELDDRLVEMNRKIAEVEKNAGGIDEEVIDDLKEKMSSAVGEAMLVRIEMERLEKGVDEKTDHLAVRLTEVETNLQDATLDVSTAVQLDRLEEIERTLAELDPDQFVRKDGRDAPQSATAPPGAIGIDDGMGGPPPTLSAPPENAEPVTDMKPAGTPDVDIGAIIAAAESATDHDEH